MEPSALARRTGTEHPVGPAPCDVGHAGIDHLPTIEEAVAAAQDLTADPEQQVALAAALMGVPEDQVRSQVLSAVPKRALSRPARDWAQPTRSPQVVVVRRRRVGPE